MLRRILEPKRDGIIGQRKLHSGEIRNLHYSYWNYNVKGDQMDRECSTHRRRGVHAGF
jgi:hypothetical protein